MKRTTTKRFPVPLAALLCAFLLLGAPVQPAGATAVGLGVISGDEAQETGGISIRLVDVPSRAQDDPRARTYIVDHLPPGNVIKRRVEIENTTPEPQTVRVYPGAATIEDGSFLWGEDPSENELTTWISMEQEEIELGPGEARMVTTTIDVPKDAPEAEQYAVIWAEMRSPAEDGSNVAQASRAGIRVYLSVGPGNGKPADFDIGSIAASRSPDGAPKVTAAVENTGGRAVDITGQLSLSGGPGALSAGPFELTEPTTIEPGGSGEVVFTLDAGVPAGPWDADLLLKSGLVEHESSANLTFPDEGEADPVEAQASSGPPWALIAGGIIVVLAVAALILWRRKAAKP